MDDPDVRSWVADDGRDGLFSAWDLVVVLSRGSPHALVLVDLGDEVYRVERLEQTSDVHRIDDVVRIVVDPEPLTVEDLEVLQLTTPRDDRTE